ncbi:MAG: DNA polymerase III subunit alpha [Alphaproteobacteria bacterium]|nr:DNA polymerase III subunit alpha [Alphaproteobacteria bacterium]
MTPYLELETATNLSFLEGASHAEELVDTARALGHAGIGIADRNTLAGVVRAYNVIVEEPDAYEGFRLLIGARLALRDGFEILCYPTDRAAYGRLSRLLTIGKRRAPKGECFLDLPDVLEWGEGQIFIACQPERPEAASHLERVRTLARRFPRNVYQAATWRYDGDDRRRIKRLVEMANAARVPLVATNDVRYHSSDRRALADVMTCIRLKTTITEAGMRLGANAERYLKRPEEMARLFRDHPEIVARSVEIAERCRFSLGDLKYEYPSEVPPGRNAQEELEERAWKGLARRFPKGITERERSVLNRELDLIRERGYASYFLTVDNIVRYARSKGILCQGRGSAANSLVCYSLWITSVDPLEKGLLFERFVSSVRDEPPDIDVDFEHERREEVIQHVYKHYGRDRAAIAATVISYRTRGALRDVSKAMGLTPDVVDVLNAIDWRHEEEEQYPERMSRKERQEIRRKRKVVDWEAVRSVGLDPKDPALAHALTLTLDLVGFPRHLSQHVGGFVITAGRLDELVPIMDAAMEDRTCIEWDKDDLNTLGILKVDVLALGMLTCLRLAFDMLAKHKGLSVDLNTMPAEDPAVYEMLQRGESLGVFQVESRGQMAMLPRLKPKEFYDLVIEVAIVRPGPIQGDMVHPYLRRREGVDKVEIPKGLKDVLTKTLGIPLFQEQAMRMAIVGAGFSHTDADRLRRAMATFKSNGRIGEFREPFISGMLKNGYDKDFAERCFSQMEGFSNYGFPESHAASFAILVYASAWLKRWHPEVFAGSLLNAQPMGFYQPAQIIRDAAENGAEVRPVDVNASDWDCTLEPGSRGNCALRLGLRQISGLAEDEIEKQLMAKRGAGYKGVRDLWLRSGLKVASLEKLAAADAFRSLGLQRRDALWAVKGLGEAPLPLFAAAEIKSSVQAEPKVTLPALGLGAEVAQDYFTTKLSLKKHPLALIRKRLDEAAWNQAAFLEDAMPGQLVRCAGLVLVRQHPESANGIVFVTMEDESGIANLVLYPDIYEANRIAVLGARLLACEGTIDRKEIVVHVKARKLFDLSDWLGDLVADDGAPPPPNPFGRALVHAQDPKRPRRERTQIEVKSRNFQ